MKHTAILLLLLLTLNRCIGENPAVWETASKNELLEKYKNAMDWFTKTPSYMVNIKYASFVDHTSMVPYDKSEGTFVKDGKNMRSLVMGLTTIQNEHFRFTVNEEDQLIVLNSLSTVEQSPIDTKSFSELLDNVQSIKKQTIAGGITNYQVQFKPNNVFSLFEFEVTEKGLLNKLSYFYSTEMTEENDDEDENGKVNKEKIKGKPRMEISFYNYQPNAKMDYNSQFSEKEYFKAEGKKIVLSEKYKNYELKDYRYDSNN